MKLTVDGQDKVQSISQNITLSGKMYLGGLPPTLAIDGLETSSLGGNMKNVFCNGKYVATIWCYVLFVYLRYVSITYT